MHLWSKKVCAVLLCVCMFIGFLPIGAQAALVDGSDYITQQMLLGDDLTFQLQGNVNYYFAENAVATLSYADRVETYRLEDLTSFGDDQYGVAAELAAAQMTENIDLTIRVGEVVVLQETYSIRNYLSALLDGSFSDQTKQLSRELLNYGAWAQKYFEHRQDDLADAGYGIEPQYAIAEEMPGVELSGSVSGVEFYGASVRFTSQTAVRYYFTGSAENCTFAVDGVEYTPVSKDGMYYIEVPGINPQDMETAMQVEVTDGTDTLSAEYVPLNYFVRSYQKTTDETYRGLLQAAYSYFKTAAAYTPEENEDLGQSGGTEETPDVVEDSENLILGFESYAQVTGAKIATGNMIGRMAINTDPSYITQGKGSFMVSAQGDYGVQGKDPYFTLDLLDTTCATNDFSGFKSITFDVYNPQAETLHIKVGLVLGSDSDNYLTTIKQSLTVNPSGWTTCTYDLTVMAGCGFYDLANVRYMTFAFGEHKGSKEDTPNTLYIDNLMGVPYGENEGISPIGFGYETGLDFETYGHEYLFTGQGKTNDAQISTVCYDSAGVVGAPSNGGSYGLRLSHESHYFPTFRMHFGKTLPADTVITFLAYGRLTSGTSLYDQSIFEYSSGGEATAQFANNQWTELKITLTEPTEYLDLFWNYERSGITSTTASGEVYIDNILAVLPQPAGDFAEGIDFEQIGHAQRFTGQGNAATDAVIQRILHTNTGIAILSDGGNYALKLSSDVDKKLSFRINFGRELAAGTVISFKACRNITASGWVRSKSSQFLFSSGSAATDSVTADGWQAQSITLPENAEYIDLVWQYTLKGFGVSGESGELFLDNFTASEPEPTVSGDFMEGVDFETRGNELLFTGIGSDQDATIERVAYANTGVTNDSGGEYALKLTHASSQWPKFRINFGKTLKAGTILTFDAYTNDLSGIRETVSVFEPIANWSEETTQYYHGSWNKQALVLTADCEYVDIMWNMDRWNDPITASNIEVYLDNFKAVEPTEVTSDITKGLNFEEETDTQYFAGQGKSQDATIERASYADLGVSAPTDGGSYALKLSHASNYWPTFRINFGKELAAGTTITFWAYGKITSGTNLYNQSIFEFSSGSPGGSGEATAEFQCDQWVQLTITLSSAAEYIDLFWNYDRASITSSTASGEVYIDVLTVTEP